MILQAMTVLEHQQAGRVDGAGVDLALERGLAGREGHVERVLEQLGDVDLAAGVGHRQQHAVELPAMQGVARRLAGLFAQE